MSKRKLQPTVQEQLQAGLESKEYLESLRRDLAGNALFIDTTAIIDYHDPNSQYQERIQDFLTRESSAYVLITSTYVVAEAVRRFVKANEHDRFEAPGKKRGAELGLYIIKDWLAMNKVRVVCVPKCVFELGAMCFEANWKTDGWTITDAISHEIIRGLGPKQIVSGDQGFRNLGFRLLPDEYFKTRPPRPTLTAVDKALAAVASLDPDERQVLRELLQ